MRKVRFHPGGYYHLFNHGVDEKEVFTSSRDYKRALVSLGAFNSSSDAPSNIDRFVDSPWKLVEHYKDKNRERLVDVVAFSFLPKHYHFFVRENRGGGISSFMHKFSKGYSRYFNLKNKREGPLWRGSFKAKRIKYESHFYHIISYIHLNPLDQFFSGWRLGRIENWEKAAHKLARYPWSSYGYYRRTIDNFLKPLCELILTQPPWLVENYPRPEQFESKLKSWATRYLVTR